MYKCHVVKCIITMKGKIAFSGTSTRDNRPRLRDHRHSYCYMGLRPLSHLRSKLGVFWRTWPEIKTKITLKIGNFSDEQGLQNNFNRKYLYNSKMVVKFLTNLSVDALKKILRFTRICIVLYKSLLKTIFLFVNYDTFTGSKITLIYIQQLTNNYIKWLNTTY